MMTAHGAGGSNQDYCARPGLSEAYILFGRHPTLL
jgi:hypothetical protein